MSLKEQDINNATFNLANTAERELSYTDCMKCQHEGCNRPAIKCIIPGESEEEGDTEEFYCPSHASENGFCAICGTFIAGYAENYCDICRDEIEADFKDDYSD